MDWKHSSRSNMQSWRQAGTFPSSRVKSRRRRTRNPGDGLAAELRDEIAGRALACGGGRSSHQARAHHADKLAERHRLGEEIALPDIATDCLQLVALVPGLDAFGHGLQSEALAQLDDSLAQAGIHLVGVAVHHVAAVDLELAE